MKKLGKALRRVALTLLAIIVLLVITIFGLRWYNGGTYTIMQQEASMGTDAQYETNDSVRAIKGDYLKGFHFIPEERTHPGTVIVYGGSEGSPNYEQAKMISEQGYEVLALYFWGQEGQAPTLANVPLDQFDEVETYIKDTIDLPTPITVIGTSKGAEFSAELVAHGFAIDNLVNFAPADHTYFGLDYTTQDELPSFTYRGEAVSFASYRNGDVGATARLMWDMATGYPPSYRATYEVPRQAPVTRPRLTSRASRATPSSLPVAGTPCGRATSRRGASPPSPTPSRHTSTPMPVTCSRTILQSLAPAGRSCSGELPREEPRPSRIRRASSSTTSPAGTARYKTPHA